MKNVFKVINNVPTHLLIWGNPFECDGQDVIVCITGNPGITDFYIEFGSELYEQTSLPVCVIGHAGHEQSPDQDINKLKDQDHLFNLKGQVEHKLDLIKNYIDKKSKVHIIGHSIGAWMIVELVHNNEFLREKIITTNLLFPTLQKLAVTKNGIFLNNYVRRIHYLAIFAAYLLYFLPIVFQQFLFLCYLKFNSLPTHYLERIQKFLMPKAVEKILLLAYDEMDIVLEINSEGIKKLCLHTNVIYSKRDNWVPISYMEDLKTLKPSLQMKCVNIGHAFVLKSSERVANMVVDHIKSASKHIMQAKVVNNIFQ